VLAATGIVVAAVADLDAIFVTGQLASGAAHVDICALQPVAAIA
jgi:hypothetical protein